MDEIDLIVGPRSALLPNNFPQDQLAILVGTGCTAAELPESRSLDVYGVPLDAGDSVRIRMRAELMWRDHAPGHRGLLVMPDLSADDPALVSLALDRLAAIATCLPDTRFVLRLLTLPASVQPEVLPPHLTTDSGLVRQLAEQFQGRGVVAVAGDPVAAPSDPVLGQIIAGNLLIADLTRQMLNSTKTIGFVADPAAVERLMASQINQIRPSVSEAVDTQPDQRWADQSPLPRQLNGKRLLFVIEKLAGRSGGAERCLIETANALALRGYEIEIACHETRTLPPFYPLLPGVILSNLKPPVSARSKLRKVIDSQRRRFEQSAPDVFPFDRIVWQSYYGGFYRRLRKHIKATRPDVVIGFMPPAISAVALARAGLPVDFPVVTVASTHNEPSQDYQNPARWFPSAFDRKRRLALIGKIDVTTVLLPEYRDWYDPALQTRIEVVPNAVVPIAPEILQRAVRGNRVIAVGRLAEVKRFDLLLNAWARITRDFPDWQLDIYGVGPQQHALRADMERLGLGGTATLKGHTTSIGQEYLSASILAHPSQYEGFPLAVTEALASGLPVVGFADCSGLNRLVEDGQNGILVPAEGDRVAAFALALAGLMGDPVRRAALSAGGPASMAAYHPEGVLDQWERLFVPASDRRS